MTLRLPSTSSADQDTSLSRMITIYHPDAPQYQDTLAQFEDAMMQLKLSGYLSTAQMRQACLKMESAD